MDYEFDGCENGGDCLNCPAYDECENRVIDEDGADVIGFEPEEMLW